MSAPNPPSIVSFPEPPEIEFADALPIIESAALEPIIFSKFLMLSLPAPPETVLRINLQ